MKTIIQLNDASFPFLQDLWRNILEFLPKLFLGIGFVLLAYYFEISKLYFEKVIANHED